MGRNQRARREPKEASGTSINRFGLIVAVLGLAGLFGLVLFLGEPPPRAPERAEASEPDEEPDDPVVAWQTASLHEIPVEPSRDFIRGPADAPVTIVEFTDFECPFCKTAHGYVGEVLARYPSEVRLVYKSFPLDATCNEDMTQQLHPHACNAALMARCAGSREQELFWRLHDAIFETDGFDDTWLEAKAAELGLEGDAFDACLREGDALDEVRADIELAGSLGVHATPTFYINGRAAPSYEIPALVAIIDHILDSI